MLVFKIIFTSFTGEQVHRAPHVVMLEVFSEFLSVIFKIWLLLRFSLFHCFSASWLWSAFILFLLYFVWEEILLTFLGLFSSYQTWKIFRHYYLNYFCLPPSPNSGIPISCVLDCLILFQRLLKFCSEFSVSSLYASFWIVRLHHFKYTKGFPGGAVVKNPPANAGDTGSSPGPGRSHMPWSNSARVP